MTSSIPSGLSMESASYMENNFNSSLEKDNNPSLTNEIIDEYTPKLFSEDQNLKDGEDSDHYEQKDTETEQLFDQDTNEEDFEIPIFKKTKVLMIIKILNEQSYIITGIFHFMMLNRGYQYFFAL